MALNGAGNHLIERRLELFSAFGPIPLFRVTERRHAGRFLDDNHLIVQIPDFDIIHLGRRGLGNGQHPHHVGLLQAAPLVAAEISVDLNPICGEQFAQSGPRLVGKPDPKRLNQRFLNQIGCNMKDEGVGGSHSVA